MRFGAFWVGPKKNHNIDYFCSMNSGEVIVALAVSNQASAIHCIRLSGAGCLAIVGSVFEGSRPLLEAKKGLYYGKIVDGGEEVDEVVVAVYRGPGSFTREDVVEISCHGSPVISARIIGMLIERGARPAMAGEFTQRAYLNGRFDLAQAEAVADLIHAESEEARKQAMQQLKGGISNQIESVRETLLHFLSLLELELDFAEEDVAFANRSELLALLVKARKEVQKLLDSFDSGNAIKEGIPLVIAGKPNAGKSTLLNTLLNENRAIVSDIPGTTRDTIEERFVFEGLQFRLIDTAGIRSHTDSDIEQLGIERTYDKLKEASLILYVIDIAEVGEVAHSLDHLAPYSDKIIWVLNKADLTLEADPLLPQIVEGAVRVSARDGDVEALLGRLKQESERRFKQGDLRISNRRHWFALKEAIEGIEAAQHSLESNLSGEIAVFELKSALEHLGSITGKITNDEVLGAIFSKFCIGK